MDSVVACGLVVLLLFVIAALLDYTDGHPEKVLQVAAYVALTALVGTVVAMAVWSKCGV